MKKGTTISILVILIVAIILGTIMQSGNTASNGISIMVYKSASCGCCEGYVSALKSEGYDVDIEIVEDMQALKDDYNIPSDMRSCHTSIVNGYFVEGHVPVEAVNKLLQETPEVDGIVLPGMPAGSPGMSGYQTEPFKIYSITNGEVSEFVII